MPEEKRGGFAGRERSATEVLGEIAEQAGTRRCFEKRGQAAGTMEGNDRAGTAGGRGVNRQPLARIQLLRPIQQQKIRRFQRSHRFEQATLFHDCRIPSEMKGPRPEPPRFDLRHDLLQQRRLSRSMRADDCRAPVQCFQPPKQELPRHPRRETERQRLEMGGGKRVVAGDHELMGVV